VLFQRNGRCWSFSIERKRQTKKKVARASYSLFIFCHRHSPPYKEEKKPTICSVEFPFSFLLLYIMGPAHSKQIFT
jgi:hypothetical protein